MPQKRQPSYRRQRGRGKRSDRAFVEIEGARYYLGEYQSAASWAEYHRILAEHHATPGLRPNTRRETVSVADLILAFWRHAEEYYRSVEGDATGEADNFRPALRALRKLYGHTEAGSFGPRKLKAVRQVLVEQGLARTTVNQHVGRIKRVFRWGVAEELVSASVWESLRALHGLRAGQGSAREPKPVRCVSDAHVEAIRPLVASPIWGLVRLQRLTGCRSGELVRLCAADLNTSGETWVYEPHRHKTRHRGHQRIVYLGPKSQEVLRPFMASRSLSRPLFSPRDAMREILDRRANSRVTPPNCGNRAGKKRKESPQRTPGESYTVDSYRRAIVNACDQLGIPRWTPHQLRHTVATEIRSRFGIEAARIILGHSCLESTEIYAEADLNRARDIMNAIG